jgi:hypothetical protein
MNKVILPGVKAQRAGRRLKLLAGTTETRERESKRHASLAKQSKAKQGKAKQRKAKQGASIFDTWHF